MPVMLGSGPHYIKVHYMSGQVSIHIFLHAWAHDRSEATAQPYLIQESSSLLRNLNDSRRMSEKCSMLGLILPILQVIEEQAAQLREAEEQLQELEDEVREYSKSMRHMGGMVSIGSDSDALNVSADRYPQHSMPFAICAATCHVEQ